METKEVGISGMSCGSCARRVETFIKNWPGVQAVAVNLAKKSATVTYDESMTGVEAIKRLVKESGYEPYDIA